MTANTPMAIANQRLRRLRCGVGAAGVSLFATGVSLSLAGVSSFMKLFLPLSECLNRLVGGNRGFERVGDAAGDRTLQRRARGIFEQPAFAISDRAERKHGYDSSGKPFSQPAIAGGPIEI